MYVDPALLQHLDERIRLSLESTRDSDFSGLLWATALVLLGVILEGPELIHELRKRITIFPGSSLAATAYPTEFSTSAFPVVQKEGGEIRKWLSFLGWFILLIGLGGEGVFDGLVNNADGALQTFNDILVSSTEIQAATAQERAANVEHENLQLQKEVLGVRMKIAGRDLNPEQQSRITASVCNFGGINVLMTLHDAGKEINDLRDKIRAALPENCMGKPGFVVSVSSPASETKPFSGVQVILRSEDTDPQHKAFAETLVAALMREGILAVGPLPPQDRGAVRPGATAYKVEASESLGGLPAVAIATGPPVEIAIGDKP
jgi:hypothetical protein